MAVTETQQPPTKIDLPPAPPPTAKRILPRLILILVLAVAAFIVWKVFFAKPKLPDNVVALSGRIEGDDSAVSPKTSGRILEIRYREGDLVKAGDVIATLDDQQMRDREEQARAALLQAQAQMHSAKEQIPVLEEQLQETRLQSGQSTIDAEGRVHQAEAELAAAEADLAQQQASLKLALFDQDAYTRLAKTGAVSERQGRQAVTTADMQQAIVAASQRKVEAAQGALNVAKANLQNPDIRNAQSAGIRKQILQQQAQIANADADVQRAQAQLNEAQANRQDLTVIAPFDGTM